MSPTVAPPEIWDRILDNLWDNKKTLKACSLTCSTWLYTSRFHLFRITVLRGRPGTSRDYGVLRDVLAQGSSSRIGSMALPVRHLNIQISQHQVEEQLKILPYFAGVTELTLCGLDNCDKVIRQFEFLPKVETLHLHSWMLKSPGPFVDLLSLFPVLSKLDLRQVELPRSSLTLIQSDSSSYDSTAEPRIRRLDSVVLDSMPTMYRTPSELPNVHPLLGPPLFPSYPRQLELVLYGQAIGYLDDEIRVNDVLRAAGASLEHLHMSLWEPTVDSRHFRFNSDQVTAVPEPDQLKLDLLENTNLRSLTFHIVLPTRLRLSITNAWIVALVSRTSPAANLEEVVLDLPMLNRSMFESLDWDELGGAFAALCKQKPQVIVKIVLGRPVAAEHGEPEMARLELVERLLGCRMDAHRLQVVWK